MLTQHGRTGWLRASGRHDRILLAGLTIALLTMFDRTIWFVLQIAAEVEQSYGVRLVPALVVLTAIFVVHLHTKRQETKAEAAAAALQARLAEDRSRELERLSEFGELLASALTPEAIRTAGYRFLPEFAEERPASVLVRTATGWDTLVDTIPVDPAVPPIEERIKVFGLSDSAPHWKGLLRHGSLCAFPLVAGATQVGLLTVSEQDGPLSPRTERALCAVAALLAIAIRNVQLFTSLKETALTDSLTGCYNRSHLFTVLDAELRRARRTASDMAVAVVDLDNFKTLNDEHGHQAGDAALAALGQRLRSVLRRSDVRCRLGGDEFAIVLPDTPPAGAAYVAETLRREIEALRPDQGVPFGITASVGVVSAMQGEVDAADLLHRADLAQYRAKRAGGNQVSVFQPPTERPDDAQEFQARRPARTPAA